VYQAKPHLGCQWPCRVQGRVKNPTCSAKRSRIQWDVVKLEVPGDGWAWRCSHRAGRYQVHLVSGASGLARHQVGQKPDLQCQARSLMVPDRPENSSIFFQTTINQHIGGGWGMTCSGSKLPYRAPIRVVEGLLVFTSGRALPGCPWRPFPGCPRTSGLPPAPTLFSLSPQPNPRFFSFF
jgi:hypothetical protein